MNNGNPEVLLIFGNFFKQYLYENAKSNLSFVVTSSYRKGNPNTNPHAIEGNAIDITLRKCGDYAAIKEYNKLFEYMFDNWPFRAGIDNTWGNIHIHIDLGQNRPSGQNMPYFFKEDDGRWKYQIKEKGQIE